MPERSIYSKSKEVFNLKFAGLDVYHMKPGTIESKHYHDGLEVVYVLDGNSSTHEKGEVYVYEGGEVHEVINDSPNELVLVCFTIPAESSDNTHFV